ncbi:MAG: glycosyltransferase family 2 protein [Chlamydiales bacterium]
MKFSVITITRNSETYLSKTLTSVAQQTFLNYEHIIWDGGSVDQTLNIASSFSNITLYQGQDEGISDAMNRSAALAKGEFLIYLHADDLLVHSQVLNMVDRILTLHPTFHWLYGRANFIDFQGKIRHTTPYEPFTFKRLRRYNFITHPATFVRRSLFQKVGGFRKDLHYCMDYDLWLRIAATGNFPLALSTILACFRQHPSSRSTHQPIQVANEAYHVRNRYVNLFERYRSYLTWKKRRQKSIE